MALEDTLNEIERDLAQLETQRSGLQERLTLKRARVKHLERTIKELSVLQQQITDDTASPAAATEAPAADDALPAEATPPKRRSRTRKTDEA